LTDIDIAEVQISKQLNEKAAKQLVPIIALLDFWRALRWLIPGWPAVNGKGKAMDDPDKNALAELLSEQYSLISVVSKGQLEGKGKNVPAANDLLARARTLARRENFFHWQTFFPDVFSVKNGNGFDIVIGNPLWDRIKLQEVEWFAERSLEIAREPRAADRKNRIAVLQKKRAALEDLSSRRRFSVVIGQFQ
jgi:hypothetical protein